MLKEITNMNPAKNQAQQLLRAHLKEIDDRFPLLAPEKQKIFLEHVSVLAASARNQRMFDGMTARETRKRQNLAQHTLSWELGLQVIQLHFYESGQKDPADHLDRPSTIAYLAWLKKMGYNPLNL